MTNKKTPADLYECHCNHCGDRFWIPPPDADVSSLRCPTCKKMTPLIVLRAACKEGADPTCTCDEFKKALEIGSGADWYFPVISVHEGKYEMGCMPINFCPWCGERVPEIKKERETEAAIQAQPSEYKCPEHGRECGLRYCVYDGKKGGFCFPSNKFYPEEELK